jgi:predicted lipoprotein with Yx(FWY)xxD motif
VTRRTTLLVAAIAAAGAAAALVVVLTRSPAKSTGRASGGADRRAAVRVARTRLGRILVDARGHTLYLFLKDRHGRSACYGACAQIWPPALASETPVAGRGVASAKLTTTRRKDHTRQLVYNGHPLYAMGADTRPGEVEGEGFLGTWFVVSPTGDRVAEPGASSSPAGY